MKPAQHLKNIELLQRYSCGICFEICVRPVQCAGVCKRIYCMKCVSQWKVNQDQCPVRCSTPFIVQLFPNFQVEFNCPFNPKQCKLEINGLDQFNNHFQICEYVPKETLERENNRINYKCNKGHELQFFIGTYQQMCKSTCISCNEQKLCRSLCRICDELYCVECRIPKCSKSGCPIGHKFNYIKSKNLGYICDVCGVSISLTGQGVYDDNKCNFGICNLCYKNLPQQQAGFLVKFNKSQQCQCHNLLVYIGEGSISLCSLCKKEKLCVKNCKQCNNLYCLKCKLIDIDNKGRCSSGHYFEKKISTSPCMMCLLSPATFRDTGCQIKLCQKCKDYCMKIISDKQRFFTQINCIEGHPLKYYSGQEDIQKQCYQCHENKLIRLFCSNCKGCKLYCGKCKRPPPMDKCYLGHPMMPMVGMKKCLLCGQLKECLSCEQCYLNICNDCSQVA